MNTGKGQIVELILESGFRHARISCPSNLIPSPGQYLLSGNASLSDPLPVPLFSTESTPLGFTASAPVPDTWRPGQELSLRGPLGRGFIVPPSARKIALVAFDDSPARLRGLIAPALKQGAAVVLVCDTEEDNLHDDVEIQPLSALDDVLAWVDYAAFDVLRESLYGLRERLIGTNQLSVKKEAQVLVRTSIPCGGVADCGVCAVMTKSNWKLACKDGPVFDLREI
jgi:NAD(P)H-flavin reductase